MHAAEFEARDLKQQAAHGVLGYYAMISDDYTYMQKSLNQMETSMSL
jgi:hypothetical protein